MKSKNTSFYELVVSEAKQLKADQLRINEIAGELEELDSKSELVDLSDDELSIYCDLVLKLSSLLNPKTHNDLS